jgi:hypothetical protein
MMESCFGKTVMSGVMGFGMGGLFGMFMASVSRYRLSLSFFLYHSRSTLYAFVMSAEPVLTCGAPSLSTDVLRHPLPRPRRAGRRPERCRLPAAAAAAGHGLQGHGHAILRHGQELWQGRRAVRGY